MQTIGDASVYLTLSGGVIGKPQAHFQISSSSSLSLTMDAILEFWLKATYNPKTSISSSAAFRKDFLWAKLLDSSNLGRVLDFAHVPSLEVRLGHPFSLIAKEKVEYDLVNRAALSSVLNSQLFSFTHKLVLLFLRPGGKLMERPWMVFSQIFRAFSIHH